MKLYKGVDGINIAIMTCANYNCTDANAVEREQERTLHIKDLAKVNYDPARDHTKKLSIKEYKENQDMKRELKQERQRLLSKNEHLKEIETQLDKAYDVVEKAYPYNQEVERYCNEQGISFYQYEKQCFWVDRDYGSYPEPEYNNPERNWEKGKEIELERHREERER